MPNTHDLMRQLGLWSRPESQWKGEIEGWTVNFLNANHWRIKRTVPWEDALQEAVVVFLRVKRKYPGVEPKHFMALYKTSWTRHFTDLSNDDTAYRCLEPLADGFETEGATDNEGYLTILVEQAPAEIRMVLGLLLAAPQEVLGALLAGWRDSDKRTSHNGSKRINELLGLPLEQDTLTKVREYFE